MSYCPCHPHATDAVMYTTLLSRNPQIGMQNFLKTCKIVNLDYLRFILNLAHQWCAAKTSSGNTLSFLYFLPKTPHATLWPMGQCGCEFGFGCGIRFKTSFMPKGVSFGVESRKLSNTISGFTRAGSKTVRTEKWPNSQLGRPLNLQ